MTKEELLELLDIEHGSEFTYYENIAELLEAEKEIGADPILQVLKEVDFKVFAEIVESYFFDIMDKMPGDDVDIYNLLESVKRTLISLAEASGREEDDNLSNSDSAIYRLAEFLDSFHNHYALTDNCEVIDKVSGKTERKPLRDALSDNRLAILDNKELDFNFDDAKNFTLDEFIIGIGDLYDE